MILAVLAWVGLTAIRKPEREDEARFDAPDFIKRIESETRVKYEMDLLSRMQLALLSDHPLDVPGLQIAAKTILATEAGGDRPRSVLERVGLWRRPTESILEPLLGDWRTHVGEGEPVDDTSIVVVRRTIWS